MAGETSASMVYCSTSMRARRSCAWRGGSQGEQHDRPSGETTKHVRLVLPQILRSCRRRVPWAAPGRIAWRLPPPDPPAFGARGCHRAAGAGFGGQTFAGHLDCISSGTMARPAIRFTIE